ncbi:unnamed protein product [Didymodactylos carnosus]|uniref:Uncharacterized protein n=1 Tax=Didymodactylos carnosus TaxID=1234261 RepID=A0A8S2FKK0_9BILA|nr:unnamed protein product [Didymodactylos carnosus]CAF4280998.1 unnamed protein product [Didymodactylos carnosus]
MSSADWAMKWLPEKYMESQDDFFAKRGLSSHISVVDNESVVAILQDVLVRVKADDPSIEYAYCRAANAGLPFCWYNPVVATDIPEERCVASFIRYGNLTQHLCTGEH